MNINSDVERTTRECSRDIWMGCPEFVFLHIHVGNDVRVYQALYNTMRNL